MSRLAWQMMAPNAFWVQGDTAPAITERLLDGNEAVVNLTSATIRFQGIFADAASSAQAIDQAATIVGPGTNGTVSYTPVAGDTDTIGDLMVMWKVTYSGGAIEHFRSSGYQKVRVIKATA